MDYKLKKDAVAINLEQRQIIAKRYQTITKAINKEFWNSCSEEEHSMYVGSYGRGTAVDTSDVDILVDIPIEQKYRFDNYQNNGQSALLQLVKQAIQITYSQSDIKADGQVIVIDFCDGIKFEVLPAFRRTHYTGQSSYVYADTNSGGRWLSTNPKAEIEAMMIRDRLSNGLLKDTCRHIRRIHKFIYPSMKLSGIFIDSFVYRYVGTSWRWGPCNGPIAASDSFESFLLREAISLKAKTFREKCHIYAPGSQDEVSFMDSLDCLIKVLGIMVSSK